MAVQDDLRRLTQVDSIYHGYSVMLTSTTVSYPFTSWFKGRLQQANDGSIVRSVSTDGAVSGFQLGSVQQNWQSTETPNTGITVSIPINQTVLVPAGPPPAGPLGPQQPGGPVQITTGTIVLQQQLPQELTN
jgi:hypothetical protein